MLWVKPKDQRHQQKEKEFVENLYPDLHPVGRVSPPVVQTQCRLCSLRRPLPQTDGRATTPAQRNIQHTFTFSRENTRRSDQLKIKVRQIFASVVRTWNMEEVQCRNMANKTKRKKTNWPFRGGTRWAGRWALAPVDGRRGWNGLRLSPAHTPSGHHMSPSSCPPPRPGPPTA